MGAPNQDQVDRNYEAFLKRLPLLIAQHPNRWALLHDGECIDCFDTVQDAAIAGLRLYGEGQFSVQQIVQQGDRPRLVLPLPCLSADFNSAIGMFIPAGLSPAGTHAAVPRATPGEQLPLKPVSTMGLLDTGANSSCISPQLVQQLRLKPPGEAPCPRRDGQRRPQHLVGRPAPDGIDSRGRPRGARFRRELPAVSHADRPRHHLPGRSYRRLLESLHVLDVIPSGEASDAAISVRSARPLPPRGAGTTAQVVAPLDASLSARYPRSRCCGVEQSGSSSGS